MSALVTQRAHRLAGSLAALKVRVRTALATELAGAVGLAVRDVLIVALIDRIVASPTRTVTRSGGWRDEEERDRWGEPTDPWTDRDDDETRDRYGAPLRSAPDEDDEVGRMPAVPTAAAVAVGVNVGRWWLARRGSVPAAVGFGVLATTVGLAGGPVARAALAVLSAATDVLTAEAALARSDPP